MHYVVFIRPHIFKMLRALKNHFELGVFTSGSYNYMKSIVEILDPNREFFEFSLCRNQCITSNDKKLYIKDLQIALSDRSLMDTIIIDNKEAGCFLELENLIPMNDFFGSKSDIAMLSLTRYLLEFVGKKDVRVKIIRDFGIYDIREAKKAMKRQHDLFTRGLC